MPERSPELVGGAGGQEAHAHDVLFLGGLLAQLRQAAIAVAQVAVDPRDEQHEQDRGEKERDEDAVDPKIKESALLLRISGEVERPIRSQ